MFGEEKDYEDIAREIESVPGVVRLLALSAATTHPFTETLENCMILKTASLGRFMQALLGSSLLSPRQHSLPSRV